MTRELSLNHTRVHPQCTVNPFPHITSGSSTQHRSQSAPCSAQYQPSSNTDLSVIEVQEELFSQKWTRKVITPLLFYGSIFRERSKQIFLSNSPFSTDADLSRNQWEVQGRGIVTSTYRSLHKVIPAGDLHGKGASSVPDIVPVSLWDMWRINRRAHGHFQWTEPSLSPPGC